MSLLQSHCLKYIIIRTLAQKPLLACAHLYDLLHVSSKDDSAKERNVLEDVLLFLT